LAGSSFGMLDAASSLRLVTDAVHEDDALCLALTCRPLRDALWERFPAPSFRTDLLRTRDTARLCTRDAAVLASVDRLFWVWGLPQWQVYVSHFCDMSCGQCSRATQPHWLQHGEFDDEDDPEGVNMAKRLPEICVRAARCGAIWILRWARDIGCDWVEGMYVAAASAGQVRALARIKWCPPHRLCSVSVHMIVLAVR
jgi:hypothetical protein